MNTTRQLQITRAIANLPIWHRAFLPLKEHVSGMQPQERNQDDEGVFAPRTVTMKNQHATFLSNDDNLTKVVFELPRSDWHDHATESVWARPLGNDQYRIKNVPFYAHGISYDELSRSAASSLSGFVPSMMTTSRA